MEDITLESLITKYGDRLQVHTTYDIYEHVKSIHNDMKADVKLTSNGLCMYYKLKSTKDKKWRYFEIYVQGDKVRMLAFLKNNAIYKQCEIGKHKSILSEFVKKFYSEWN